MIYARGFKGHLKNGEASAVRQFESEFEARTEAHRMVTKEGYNYAEVVKMDYASQDAKMVCVMCIERLY